MEIWPECSGYEGMGLIFALLAGYCFFQRHVLRASRAFLILPLAGIAMFFLNSIRIIILIAIGHFYSPKLALEGFHIVGGWINLLFVFIISLTCLNSFNFFYRHQKPQSISTERRELPFLMPLILLISVGLFSKIFVVDFDWLYPIPVSMSAFAIFHFRKRFQPFAERSSFFACLIGIIVFYIWVYLIPNNENQNRIFIQGIQSAPLIIGLIWIVFRITGAVIIVPIAEELAFRGFLFPYLESQFKNLLASKTFFSFSLQYIRSISIFLSLILSSIMFGILHSDMLAGSLAGLGFGAAYLYRRKVIDAITSHAITNGLLAIHVIYYGDWSYW